MVVNPGWAQILDTLLVAISTCGVTCSIFGRFVDNRGADIMWRAALALVSLFVMLYPNDNVATVAGAIVLPVIIYSVWRHRRVAPPKNEFELQPAS